jgi:hypothetical protein
MNKFIKIGNQFINLSYVVSAKYKSKLTPLSINNYSSDALELRFVSGETMEIFRSGDDLNSVLNVLSSLDAVEFEGVSIK